MAVAGGERGVTPCYGMGLPRRLVFTRTYFDGTARIAIGLAMAFALQHLRGDIKTIAACA